MTKDELELGGGSGGGDDGNNTVQRTEGVYQIQANQLMLFTTDPTEPDLENPTANDHIITILSPGKLPTFMDGKIDIRGSKGVRITAGPPAVPELSPPATAETTNGVEIMVAETQYVTIYRGASVLNQKIEMFPNGILIDAGISGILTLKAGASQIVINSEGVTIQGLPLVQIN